MTDTPKPDTSVEAVERHLSAPSHVSYSWLAKNRELLRQLRKELTEAESRALQSELYANSCAAELTEAQAQLTEAQELLLKIHAVSLLITSAASRGLNASEKARVFEVMKAVCDAFSASQKEQSR